MAKYQRSTLNGEEITPDGMVLEQAIDPQEKTVAEYALDYPRIVKWIEHELGRDIETLTYLGFDQEMIELPPDGIWKRYEPGKRTYVTAQFSDGFRQILTVTRGVGEPLSFVPRKRYKPSEDDSAEVKSAINETYEPSGYLDGL